MSSSILKTINRLEDEGDVSAIAEIYFDFKSNKEISDYAISSIAHIINLTTEQVYSLLA